MTDTRLMQQLAPYLPWLIIAAVFILFALLRATRKGLRQRVDEIGYRLFGERGLLVWFWLNAPGVMLHEMSHAIAVLFSGPSDFVSRALHFSASSQWSKEMREGVSCAVEVGNRSNSARFNMYGPRVAL